MRKKSEVNRPHVKVSTAPPDSRIHQRATPDSLRTMTLSATPSPLKSDRTCVIAAAFRGDVKRINAERYRKELARRVKNMIRLFQRGEPRVQEYTTHPFSARQAGGSRPIWPSRRAFLPAASVRESCEGRDRADGFSRA